MKALPLVLALVWCAGPQLNAASHSWTGDPALGVRELEQQWTVVANKGGVIPIRGVLRFTLEATGLGWHPDRVETALARARASRYLWTDAAANWCC